MAEETSQRSELMTVHGLSKLLYEMGRTFDNLSSTRLATEEFLRTNNPKVLGSRNDLALLSDLKDAADYALKYAQRSIDFAYLCGINAQMTRTASIEPGKIRTASNIVVHTALGDYVPPIPKESELSLTISHASVESDPLTAASTAFVTIARSQPFGDGNKRSALLLSNGLLLHRGYQGMLSVPVEDPDRREFNARLSAWYLQGDDSIIAWLSAWNRRAR
ncbi:Fic family protein [Bifidobacterium aquikefiricola]|uniref:Fic family protein n=1 Tax=Bifidobacterium aquikefiricola TaxID=3059038 RepID=A0AB39U668_9BIFI